MDDQLPSLISLTWTAPLQIENQAYPVNVDALHTVFQPYGFVQKIACFEKNNTWQVRFCTFAAPYHILLPGSCVLISASLPRRM